jgi:hypothetical protein
MLLHARPIQALTSSYCPTVIHQRFVFAIHDFKGKIHCGKG